MENSLNVFLYIAASFWALSSSKLQGFSCFGNSCYHVAKKNKTWSEAQLDCMQKGSRLSSITNHQEQLQIEALIGNSRDNFWIGASDIENVGSWIWTDGCPFIYSNWVKGEPNLLNIERCVEIWTPLNHAWNNVNCILQNYYICKSVVNLCLNHTCFNGGTCYTTPCEYGSPYVCRCQPGFDPKTDCKMDIDECSSNPCIHGTCINQLNSYKCQCDPGYTGPNCAQDIDECRNSPCINGTCCDKINGFNCQCYPGFTGPLCNVDIDECNSSPCVYGSCINGDNLFLCKCFEGYFGVHCQYSFAEFTVPIGLSLGLPLLLLLLLLSFYIAYKAFKYRSSRIRAEDDFMKNIMSKYNEPSKDQMKLKFQENILQQF